MRFEDARTIDSICWQMRQADFTRGANRARIDQLFNGWPPLSAEDAAANNTAVNVNFLEATGLAHDARAQFNNAFLKPGNFFTARTDWGKDHEQREMGAIVTAGINKRMKRSLEYMECFRSKFALNILHGIGPSAWENQDCWCPTEQAIADIGIPARTLLTMKNLPFFYIYRPLTHPELYRMAKGPKVEKGWNVPMVDRCLAWLEQETLELIGQNWQDYWSPEKVSEAVKSDGGFFVGDQCATINVFDFYFLELESKEPGWRRRMLLDAWSTPAFDRDGKVEMKRDPKKSKLPVGGKGDKWEFLYSSRDNKVADKWQHIVSFQFADLSAVAPFQYHSVRSMGFLLYAICHLQNRLRCAVTEAVFENLLQMFRIKSQDDVQRALQLKIHGFSFIDDSLTPVPANERFQPNDALINLGLGQNAQLIQKHSSSYVQAQDYSAQKTEKTKFQVMAEVNAMTSLVSAGLNQAYAYQKWEYYEILRRFMKKDSRDVDVRDFRAEMLRRKVPMELLVPEAWECEPERIMGGGNKTLETAIAQQLMEWYERFNPEGQREVFRNSILAISDDAALAKRLVPDEPKVSDSVHDAELAFGALMGGTPVTPKPGLNPVEVAGKTIQLMGQKVEMIKQQGGVGNQQDVMGLTLAGKYAQAFIQQVGQDKNMKPTAVKLQKALTKVLNEVRAFMQRQQQAMKAAQQNGQNGQGPDPKDQAKAQSQLMLSQQKVQQMKESHGLRTAQRKIQFEQEFKQRQQEHQAEMRRKNAETAMELQRKQAETVMDIQAEHEKNRIKFLNQGEGD